MTEATQLFRLFVPPYTFQASVTKGNPAASAMVSSAPPDADSYRCTQHWVLAQRPAKKVLHFMQNKENLPSYYIHTAHPNIENIG
jgi:hypothetical protein